MPYPAYNDSGIPWLGAVPAHWDVLPVGAIGQLFKGNGGSKEDEVPFGVPCVRYGDLYTSHHSFISRARSFVTPERSATYTHIRFGDVLFAASGETIEEIGKSAVNLIASDAVCGGDVLVLRPDHKFVPRFLGYAADATPTVHQKASTGRGFTVVHIYASQLKRVVIAVPPLPEQDSIVRFLDHADRHIRCYIRAKQKLIKLLEEQKLAIIHRAVTRGLDPGVRLKPSGVAWLGDVPEHWEVMRFKFVAAKIVDCLHATPRYSATGEFPAIRTADITPGTVHVSSARRVESDEYARWVERLEPSPGDILYSREGERFGIAACVPEGVRLCISQRMMVFRVHPEHNAVFVMWLLNSGQVYAQAVQDVMGATAPHVNVSTIRNYFLAMPPRAEQDAVVAEIESQTGSFGHVIVAANREIVLLREYRTRLIADVVTGKLDVREAAARLPEEVEEPESVDLTEGTEERGDDDDHPDFEIDPEGTEV